MSISLLKLGSVKHSAKFVNSSKDGFNVVSETELRKKQARKAALQFLASSKEKAKKAKDDVRILDGLA